MSNNTTIARPYAKAAFAEALQHKTVASWLVLLQTAALIVRDIHMAEFLQNPRVSNDDRLKILFELCAMYLDEAGKNFLKLLAAHQRLEVLPEIAHLFAVYRIEQEKTAQVSVISAVPLSVLEQQQLTQALKVRLQREIMLECVVDSSLLGGVIIKTGDWVMDGSVRGKLVRLNTALVN